MWKRCFLLPVLAAASVSSAQTELSPVDVANLREDIRGLTQRVGDLSVRVDQLEAQNGALRDQTKSAAHDYVTLSQLNDAIAELNRAVQAAVAASQDETLKQVSGQIQKLAHQSSAAVDAGGSAAGGPATFGTDFPKQGINYTVQKGDTVALIAKKTGAKVSDIVNANKLTDPSRIRVDQTLFIPGGK